MALLTPAVSMWSINYNASFISLRLKDQYGIPDDQQGYYKLFLTGTYLFACMLLPALFKKVPRRLQFILSFIG